MRERRHTFTLANDLSDDLGIDVTTKEGRSSFVWHTWIAIAPWGYGAYVREVRGAVVIEGDKDGPRPLKYVLMADAAEELKELETLIREYDPETEIVVLFSLEFAEAGLFAAYGTYGPDVATMTPRALWEKALLGRERGVVH